MIYDIEMLLELSKTCRKISYSLTNWRYAGIEKDDRFALYKDEYIVLTYPKVNRIITIHGEDVEKAAIDVEYRLPDFDMFRCEDIEASGLIPLHENDIPKYFEPTDTIIKHYKSGDMIETHIRHEDAIHYKHGFYLNDLDKEGLKELEDRKYNENITNNF